MRLLILHSTAELRLIYKRDVGVHLPKLASMQIICTTLRTDNHPHLITYLYRSDAVPDAKRNSVKALTQSVSDALGFAAPLLIISIAFNLFSSSYFLAMRTVTNSTAVCWCSMWRSHSYRKMKREMRTGLNLQQPQR